MPTCESNILPDPLLLVVAFFAFAMSRRAFLEVDPKDAWRLYRDTDNCASKQAQGDITPCSSE